MADTSPSTSLCTTGCVLLNVPGNATAFTAPVGTGSTSITTVSNPNPGTALHTTLSNDFTLYFPCYVNKAVQIDVSSFVQAFNSDFSNPADFIPASVFVVSTGVGTPLSSVKDATLTLSPSTALFVPVTNSLPATVDYGSQRNRAEGFLEALPNATSSSSDSASSVSSTPVAITSATLSATSSVTTSAPATSPTVSPPGDDSSAPASRGTSAATTTMASSSATAPADNTTGGSHASSSNGGIIGGTIGGLVAGLIIGAVIAFLCFRTRRSNRRAGRHVTSAASGTTSIPEDGTRNEKHPMIVGSTNVTGWRKHLPQEKGADTIANSFKKTFEQARMHVEGFYDARSSRLLPDEIARLQHLASEDIVDTLLQATDVSPILEAILNRWIVERVSLQSEPTSSLLPPEFTGVPRKARWCMGTDRDERVVAAESKKGFPQAMSQWRALTGFLYPGPSSDKQFRRELDRDIEHAVAMFAEAYSPWDATGQSHINRDKSLRDILRQASDAGIELFKQPSTFMFDWRATSSQSRTMLVSPALMRRLDEHAQSLRPAEVILEARAVRVSGD